MFNRLLLCIALGTLSLASPNFARAEIPSAGKPKGFTQHDFVKASLEYNRRTMVEAYKQIGKRDPKWDDDAEKFLDGMATVFAHSGVSPFYSAGDVPTPADLSKLADAATAKGCDDPMVGYCRATLLSRMGRQDESKPLLIAASKQLMDSHYPLTRAMFAALRLARISNEPPASSPAWSKFRDCVQAVLTQQDYKGIDRRIIFAQWLQQFDEVPLEIWERTVNGAHELPNPDPWLLGVLEGRYHINKAWEARGSGTSETVTSDGLLVFDRELGKARDSLVAAWKVNPNYPEAAAAMITVAMGNGDALHENMRQWFDRAVAAQIDYDPAYTAYQTCILPRWYGNLQLMRQFAEECLATQRFDTIVPWKCLDTLGQIAEDPCGDPELWLKPGIFEDVKTLCDGYLKARLIDAKYLHSETAAVACCSGHYADAASALDAVGAEPIIDLFTAVHVMPRLEISKAYAMALDKSADVIAHAEDQAKSGQLDQAIATLNTAKANGGVKAAYFLDSRIKQLRWQKEIDGGDWVDITPGADFLGWEQVAGKWHANPDGSVIAKCDRGAQILTFQDPCIRPRYEIELTLDYSDAKSPFDAGISLVSNDPCNMHGWMVRDRGDKSLVDNEWVPENSIPVIIKPGSNVLLLRRWDDKVKFDFNDKHSRRVRDMNKLIAGPQIYFAVGAIGNPIGTEIRLSKIRLRLLTEEPPKD